MFLVALNIILFLQYSEEHLNIFIKKFALYKCKLLLLFKYSFSSAKLSIESQTSRARLVNVCTLVAL